MILNHTETVDSNELTLTTVPTPSATVAMSFSDMSISSAASVAADPMVSTDDNSVAVIDETPSSATATEATSSVCRKVKRWHTAEDSNSALDTKMHTETLAFETTYLYNNRSEWPAWIATLKDNKAFKVAEILRGFTDYASRGGLNGFVVPGDNKYFLSFESPFDTDILPTNRTYKAKAHALNKGKTEMRYPALREVLIDMLEEAHVIRK